MWAKNETNWAEVRLDPMSLAFIAQVDIFLYFPFFSIFLPFIYIFFHPWAVKGVEGGNNTWWSQDFNLYPSQVNFISKYDGCRPECSPYSFKKVLFCRVVKSNHTVLSVFLNKTHSKVVWIISNRPILIISFHLSNLLPKDLGGESPKVLGMSGQTFLTKTSHCCLGSLLLRYISFSTTVRILGYSTPKGLE